MNQQDYIDRGDLATIEFILNNLICIDPEVSSVINHKDFIKVEVALRTWRQKLSELMMKRMKEEAMESMSPKKSNGSGRSEDTQKTHQLYEREKQCYDKA